MYFWSINSVARDLKANSLSEWQKTKYYIATVLYTFFESWISGSVSGFNYYTFVSYFLSSVVVIYSMVLIFNINHKADDRNFIERLTCFSLPAIIKTSVFYFLVSYIYKVFSVNVHIPSIVTALVFITLGPITYILMFYYIKNGFKALHA